MWERDLRVAGYDDIEYEQVWDDTLSNNATI